MDIIIIILLIIGFTTLIVVLVQKNKKKDTQPIIDAIGSLLENKLQSNRTELSVSLKDNRKELSDSLKDNREELSNALFKLSQSLDERLNQVSDRMSKNAKNNREELNVALKNFTEVFNKNIDNVTKTTEMKLEKIRETVDEKLHKTLEDRLGKSFKLVGDRLEAVQKGLGEMQHLASGVGDLKKVLSNVKTRGLLGEIQLGNILEQIMAPEQYQANVKTKHDADNIVEYAIKLPGKDNDGKEVYLPIDAKFPQEDYLRLQTAYEKGDTASIDKATKDLVNSIYKFASSIQNKYIDPPHTTDFGIMFLPIEGLYAEVVRQPDIVAELQRKYKIIITGPTTLAAMLNSLQMGFKTLAIQKRSSEVWDLLGAIKTEFGKFGGVLEKTQKKLNEANKELDTLVGTRTNMILRKLKKVEELPSHKNMELLEENRES